MHATEMPEAPHPIPLPPKSDLSDFDHVWWRSRASPTSTMFGGEVGQARPRPCLVAKSGKSDFDHVWWRSRASPTSTMFGGEVGQARLRPCLVAKSGKPDFAWGEGGDWANASIRPRCRGAPAVISAFA